MPSVELDVCKHLLSHSEIKANECVHCERILVSVYRGRRLLRVALLVVFRRRGLHHWLPLICGVRSGGTFLFLPVLKAEAGLGEEAAVGEDAEDIEHPVN